MSRPRRKPEGASDSGAPGAAPGESPQAAGCGDSSPSHQATSAPRGEGLLDRRVPQGGCAAFPPAWHTVRTPPSSALLVPSAPARHPQQSPFPPYALLDTGQETGRYESGAWLYWTEDNYWEYAAYANEARRLGHSFTLLPSGRVLVARGTRYEPAALNA